MQPSWSFPFQLRVLIRQRNNTLTQRLVSNHSVGAICPRALCVPRPIACPTSVGKRVCGVSAVWRIEAKQQRLALCDRDRADLLGQRATLLSNRRAPALPQQMHAVRSLACPALGRTWPCSTGHSGQIFPQNLLLPRNADLQADRSGLAGVPTHGLSEVLPTRCASEVSLPGSLNCEDCRCPGQPTGRGYELVAPSAGVANEPGASTRPLRISSCPNHC